MKRWIALALVLLSLLALQQVHADNVNTTKKISPWLQKQLSQQPETSFFVVLRQQAALKNSDIADNRSASAVVYERLQDAAHSQAALQSWLSTRNVPFQSYWVVNAVLVKGNQALATQLARRDDILRLEGNPYIKNDLPHTAVTAAVNGDDLLWGLHAIGADQLWREGITGQGIVIAGNDTGIQWDHPALKRHYRGWHDDGSVDHNYNWWDAVAGQPVPYDDHGHGTHTLGTALGDDGAGHRIGVAPGARWIGCKNMDRYGVGSPARYLSCFQFFIAPTDSNGENPRPDLAPDLVINSWSCPPAEGCSAITLAQGIKNVQAAGIGLIVAAGNAGPSCSSISDPPGNDGNTLSVGASNSRGELALFSGRGPVQSDGSGRNKPDVVAPGVDIYSSVPDNSYQGGWQGTSMATPHVVGLAALVLSAVPTLREHPYALFNIIRASSKERDNTNCPGSGRNPRYNNSWGYGFVSAPRALYFAQHAIPVYNDNLSEAWHDRSTSLHDMQQRTQVHTGMHSIAVLFQSAGQRLRFVHTPISTTKQTHLLFWINGGSQGREKVAIGVETITATVPITVSLDTFLPEGHLTANHWQRLDIPLTAFGLADHSALLAIDWINAASGTQPSFYLDDINLWESKAITPITLTAAYFDTAKRTLLRFNQPLEQAVAQDASHYQLFSTQDAHYRSGLYPTHVIYNTANRRLWLSWLYPISTNTPYTLSLRNLLSATDTALSHTVQPLQVKPWSLSIDAADAPTRQPHSTARRVHRIEVNLQSQNAQAPIRDANAIAASTFIDKASGQLLIDVQNQNPNNDYLTRLYITNEHIGGLVARSRLDSHTQTWQDLPSLPARDDSLQLTFPAHSHTLLTFTPYLPLADGWQLSCLPRWQAQPSAEQALQPFGPALTVAYGWQHGAWQLYQPNLPAYANTLTKVYPGQALWLQLDHPTTGLPLSPVTTTMTVTLQAGWNLVGYPMAQPAYLPAALGACQDAVDGLYAWRNQAWQRWQPGGAVPALALLPGEGYWVHATAYCRWRMDAGR